MTFQHWWEADLNVLGIFPSVVHVIQNAESDIDQQGARNNKGRKFSPWRGALLRASYEYRAACNRKQYTNSKIARLMKIILKMRF